MQQLKITQLLIGAVCVACWTLHAATDVVLKPAAFPRLITLKEAIALAQSNNADVVMAREQALQQRARLNQAWALYLPTVSVSGTYTANFPEIVTNFGSASQNTQQAQVLEGLSGLLNLTQGLRNNPADLQSSIAQATGLHESAVALSQTKPLIVVVQPGNVFDGKLVLNQSLMNLASLATIQVAQVQTEQARAHVTHVSSSKALDVARAYMQAVKALRVRRVAQNGLERVQAQIKRLQQKLKMGFVRSADIKRMQVEENNNKTQLNNALSDEQYALGRLGLLMGQEETFSLQSQTFVKSYDQLYDENMLVSKALATRTELKSQRYAISVAEQMRQSVYAKYFPTLDFSAQGFYTTNTAGFIDRAFRGLVMIQASMNIYDGGDGISKIDEYQAKIREEKAKSADLNRQIQAEVQGHLLDIETKRKALMAAEANLALSESIQNETQSNFRSGLLDTLDLIDANHQLIDSEINIENARTDVELAQIELAYASGDIYETLL